VDNVKIDLGEMGWGGIVKIDVAQDRDHWKALVNVKMNPWDPYKGGKFLISCTTGGFLKGLSSMELISMCEPLSYIYIYIYIYIVGMMC
jgi:hypothetical protein